MLSVIIPIGGDDGKGRRRRNLLEQLRCIRRQAYRDYEVVLVEEVFGEPLYADVEVDKYVSLKASRGVMNISWARNVGARSSKGDKLLHLDADVIFAPDYFDNVDSFNEEAFSAWSRMHRFTEEGAQTWLKTRSFEALQKDQSLFEARDGKMLIYYANIYWSAGLAYCFDRDFFFKRFGGFNENFFGWGGEDCDATLRFSRLFDEDYAGAAPYYKLPFTIYHLPHGGRRTGRTRFNEWGHTKNDPMLVTERLLRAELGRRKGPTVINWRE